MEATCEGPPLHSAIHTCGAAARLEHSPISVSAAIYGDAAGTALSMSQTANVTGSHSTTPVCGSAAAQINFAVSRTVSIGGLLARSNLVGSNVPTQTYDEDSGALQLVQLSTMCLS